MEPKRCHEHSITLTHVPAVLAFAFQAFFTPHFGSEISPGFGSLELSPFARF